jgi:hypothetical protein
MRRLMVEVLKHRDVFLEESKRIHGH